MSEIRKATRNDVPAVAAVRRAAILHGCSGYYPPDKLKIWTDGELTRVFYEVVEAHFYVATIADVIVGTGMVDPENGKVDGVFVHPAHMGAGVGTSVMRYLEQLAREHGLGEIFLEATLNAAPFYRSLGFMGDQIAVYHSPRGISLDCVPMVKRLTG